MEEALLHEASIASSRVRGVVNWFRGDANARFFDPNADELVEMMVRVNNVRNKGGEVPVETQQGLDEFWQNRKTNYERNGIGTNCTSYQILNDLHDGSLSKEVIGPHCFEALRRIARGSLYTSQVRRDGNPNYVWDDARQLEEINDEYEQSTEREQGLMDKYMEMLAKRVTSVPDLNADKVY